MPNGIFHCCTLWDGAQARWEGRWDAAAAVAATWKLRSTFRPGFPEVLGSWWEIFENGDHGSTQNFAADVVSIVVWARQPFLEKAPFKKCTFFAK